MNRCNLVSNRITRWIMQNQEYGLEIIHIRGIDNFLADILSRHPVPATLTLNAESMRTNLKYPGEGRNRLMWWAGNDQCSARRVESACTVRVEDFLRVHYSVRVVFKKRQNFLNSVPAGTESVLRLLSPPSGRF
jgi:hypothetical protein